MAAYKATVRHVRYWRGVVHRWSTNHTYIGVPSMALNPDAALAVLAADDAMCWGPVVTDGCTYACDIYDVAAGGTPITSLTLLDPDVPANWTGYGGGAWTGITGNVMEPVAEVALSVRWPAGLSSTGKPVFLRNWWHAVPPAAVNGGAIQISAPTQAGLTTGADGVKGALVPWGLTYGSASGRFAGPSQVSNYYENHQMPRGRRRPPVVSATGKTRFPAGLLVVPGSDGSLES